MQDRFKFRAVLHQNKYEEYRLEKFSHQKVFDVTSINLGIEYSTIEIIAEYPNGDWAVREIEDKDIDLIQCTGLKDKNGNLIYEGDIVKFYDGEFLQTMKIIWDNDELDFKAIGLKKSVECYENDFTYLGYIKKELYSLEVIGNVYQHEYLLKEYNLWSLKCKKT